MRVKKRQKRPETKKKRDASRVRITPPSSLVSGTRAAAIQETSVLPRLIPPTHSITIESFYTRQHCEKLECEHVFHINI